MATVTYTTLAGQSAIVVRPSGNAVSRLFVWCHGGDELYQFPVGGEAYPQWAPLAEMLYFVAERQYVVVCPTLYDLSLTYTSAALPTQSKGQTWGNDASTTQLASVIAAAQALPGVSSGKYALGGHSMGNITIFNHLRRLGAGQSNVAGVLAVCPASDLAFFRGTDAAPYGGAGADTGYASVNRAHGIGGVNGTTACDAAFNAIAAVKSPPNIAPSITVPWRGWTNANDTTALPSLAVTLAGLIPNGKGTTESRGSGGHDFSGCVGNDAHNWLAGLSW